MESILVSIKKLIGLTEEYVQYDTDIITHINTVFAILHQLGVGPVNGFVIRDKSTCWCEYTGDEVFLESVKSYIYLKVKLIFDPPQSSAHIETMKQEIAELEWRLNVYAD